MSCATPIVLVPGSLCDAELFAHQVEHLGAGREVTVARLDRQDSIEAMAAEVLDGAPETFVAVGLSLGGIVAMEMHRQAPERIEALALLDTNLDAPSEAQLEQRARWALMVDAGRFDEIVEGLLPVSTHGRGALDGVVAGMAHRLGPEVFRRQNTALQHRPDRRTWLADVDVPVLVACGEHDAVCPVALHEELVGHARRGTLGVIEGAGHLASLDRPEEVSEFLHHWVGITEPAPMT